MRNVNTFFKTFASASSSLLLSFCSRLTNLSSTRTSPYTNWNKREKRRKKAQFQMELQAFSLELLVSWNKMSFFNMFSHVGVTALQRCYYKLASVNGFSFLQGEAKKDTFSLCEAKHSSGERTHLSLAAHKTRRLQSRRGLCRAYNKLLIVLIVLA